MNPMKTMNAMKMSKLSTRNESKKRQQQNNETETLTPGQI